MRNREERNIRRSKIAISKAGGNASYSAKSYNLPLPTAWCNKLELTPWDRDVEIRFDEKTKTITARKIDKTEKQLKEDSKIWAEKKLEQINKKREAEGLKKITEEDLWRYL